MKLNVKYKIIFLLFITFVNLPYKNFIATYATDINKVSVIIPVYNTSIYLKDCFDSIVGQSLYNIEIICINDGSTDDSLEIIKEYSNKDKRIKLITQDNKGAACARNEGLKLASGEYIAFIDSDDTIDLNAYEICYEKAINKNADILIFGEDNFSVNATTYTDGFNALNVPGAMMLWNKLYKRSFLMDNNIKFLEDAKCYHDECFNSITFPKAKCIECIPNKFYHYKRNRSGSIQTSSNAKKKADSTLIYANYVCDVWRKNNYIQEHGDWLLRKIIFMINRNIKKLDENDKYYYSKALLDIVDGDIYNETNINKLSKFEKSLLHNWIKNV